MAPVLCWVVSAACTGPRAACRVGRVLLASLSAVVSSNALLKAFFFFPPPARPSHTLLILSFRQSRAAAAASRSGRCIAVFPRAGLAVRCLYLYSAARTRERLLPQDGRRTSPSSTTTTRRLSPRALYHAGHADGLISVDTLPRTRHRHSFHPTRPLGSGSRPIIPTSHTQTHWNSSSTGSSH